MSRHQALTIAEKEQVYEAKLAGRTLPQIAQAMDCSVACARKWWRCGHAGGLASLQLPRRGRGPSGLLSRCDPQVAAQALSLKQNHPNWGPNRVLVDLQHREETAALGLPSRSQLALYFKAHCPECVHTVRRTSPPPHRPPRASGVHEIWQLDSQEGIRLRDGQICTICNIRDPLGAAMIASRAFVVTTTRHWRKLSEAELRQVLRDAFAEWQTLPDAVQTDNELVLGGCPTDPFPSRLSLWLIGLGIRHLFIRPGQPTDQAQVERAHRSMDGFALNAEALQRVETLQAALDHERVQYHQWFPARASGCAGRPPLVAYPSLQQPRRSFRPEWEPVLFDIQRCYDYLATFHFQRKVNRSGQVSLGRRLYSLGRALAGQSLSITFNANDCQWLCANVHGEVLARRPLIGMDFLTLTGLTEPIQPRPCVVQLSFPCFIA